MINTIQIQVLPEVASTPNLLKTTISKQLDIPNPEIKHIEILKRSIDARQKTTKINLKVAVYIKEEFVQRVEDFPEYQDVNGKDEVIIIGAGPAGLFAALKLIENGKKPIVIERGKDVRSRRRDLVNLTKKHIVNEDSNYCFGEGGAGTFSDGKLYTRSKKRGDVNKVLDVLVRHGATPEIRVNAHPHIGTNKLPKIIQAIRDTIIQYGGQVLFDSRLTDISIKNNAVKGVELQNGTKIKANKIILATGHSSRDIFELLHQKGIAIEAKAFGQKECFEAGVKFANVEGIVPAPEATHAVKGAIDEALECKKNGQKKTILFNLCGHGHFDMQAYGDYFNNKLSDDSYNAAAVNKALEKLPKIA